MHSSAQKLCVAGRDRFSITPDLYFVRGQLNSTGGVKVIANSDNVKIETKARFEALTEDEGPIYANVELGIELATSLNALKFNVHEVKLEPFFNLQGALSADLRAPATLSFEPWSLTFKRDGLSVSN